MAIRVNDLPHNLTLLLFVRQAWSIAPDMDIPPLSPEPDCGQSSLPKSADVDTWTIAGGLHGTKRGAGMRLKIRRTTPRLLRCASSLTPVRN